MRAEDIRTPGVWEHFDEQGGRLGFARRDLQLIYPDPPLNPGFPPHAMAMTPAQKKYQAELRAWRKERAAMLAAGKTEGDIPPPPEDPDETPESKAKKKREEDKAKAKAKAAREADRENKRYATNGEAAVDAKKWAIARSSTGAKPQWIRRSSTSPVGIQSISREMQPTTKGVGSLSGWNAEDWSGPARGTPT